MKIILEGTEGAGKTTLAGILHNQTGWNIMHRSKPKTELEREYMYRDYLESTLSDENEIWDRCWYSELVYGPIMRDQSYMTIQQMNELEKNLAANGGAIIIHCTDTTELLWARATARGEEYVKDINTLDALRNSYEALMHGVKHYIPVVRYELSKGLPIL